MVRKIPTADMVKTIDPVQGGDATIILWKAKQPLSEIEHEQLSIKLRYEQEQTGVKIILVPFTVDAEELQQERVPAETKDSMKQKPGTDQVGQQAGTAPDTEIKTDQDPDTETAGRPEQAAADTEKDTDQAPGAKQSGETE